MDLLTTRQVAVMMFGDDSENHVRNVQNYVKRHGLKATRIGRDLLIRREDAQQFQRPRKGRRKKQECQPS